VAPLTERDTRTLRRGAGGERNIWIAFHLHYHEDPERVLLEVVRPAAAELLRQGAVDSFFFIRYVAGGPHVRLRLRVRPGRAASVAAVVEDAARRLFACRPSRRRLDEAALRRALGPAAAGGPWSPDALVLEPDNACLRAPFAPEVQRYGGARYLPASLGVFALSSAVALGHAATLRAASRGRRLAVALEALLGQALGYAADGEELRRLLLYGLDAWGSLYPAAARQGLGGDPRQRESLEALWPRQLERRLALDPDAPLAAAGEPIALASLRLSRMLGRRDAPRRARVGWSQLHMTANRLGLTAAEEVYLGALWSAALAECRQRWPEGWRRLERTLDDAHRRRLPAGSLEPGLPAVLAAVLGVVAAP
jgi:hypothetical protein